MRPRFRLASAIVALMAAIFVTAPVAATSPWLTFKQVGTSAFASNEECVNNADGSVTCVGQSVSVFDGKSSELSRKGEQVCYSDSSNTFDPNTGETIEVHALSGCTFDAGTLTIDGLTSITLAPTVIELMAFECDASGCTESPDGSTIVEGTWTGVGPIFSEKSRSKFGDGSCIQVVADKAAAARPRSRGRSKPSRRRWPMGPSPSGLAVRPSDRARSLSGSAVRDMSSVCGRDVAAWAAE